MEGAELWTDCRDEASLFDSEDEAHASAVFRDVERYDVVRWWF